MTGARVMGLDLSTTSTGVALPDGTTRIIRPRGADRMARVSDICRRVEPFMRLGADVAVIETPTVGRGGIATLMALGDLHGPVGVRLWENTIERAYVVGSTLKKFATGKGGAATDKDAMVVAAQECGLTLSLEEHDAADAHWLRCMGDLFYNGVAPTDGRDDLAKARAECLKVVKWPQLTLRTEAAR